MQDMDPASDVVFLGKPNDIRKFIRLTSIMSNGIREKDYHPKVAGSLDVAMRFVEEMRPDAAVFLRSKGENISKTLFLRRNYGVLDSFKVHVLKKLKSGKKDGKGMKDPDFFLNLFDHLPSAKDISDLFELTPKAEGFVRAINILTSAFRDLTKEGNSEKLKSLYHDLWKKRVESGW